jgi:hypothetical protein
MLAARRRYDDVEGNRASISRGEVSRCSTCWFQARALYYAIAPLDSLWLGISMFVQGAYLIGHEGNEGRALSIRGETTP